MHKALGLDHDDTITSAPEMFSILTKAYIASGREVVIVTQRMPIERVRVDTISELDDLDVHFTKLILVGRVPEEWYQGVAEELSGEERKLWGKVVACKYNNIGYYCDNDSMVLQLLQRYCPEIILFQAIKRW